MFLGGYLKDKVPIHDKEYVLQSIYSVPTILSGAHHSYMYKTSVRQA